MGESRAGSGAGGSARPSSSRSVRARGPAGPGGAGQRPDRREQGQRTRRRLHDAAVQVFSQRGYHAARVDDIVTAAKTSHGTFYIYFANKEEAFRSLVGEVLDDMTALAASLGPVSPGREGYEEIRRWLTGFAELYDRHGPILRAWTEAEAYDRSFARLGDREAGRFIAVLAQRLQEAGESTVASLEVAGVAITAMIERFNYYRVSRGLAVDQQAAIDVMARMIHAGCFVPGRLDGGPA